MSIEQIQIAPELERALQRFLDSVTLERGLSDNTARAYERDLSRYLTLLTDLGIRAPDEISQTEV
ncbi:MAG: site-specific integrase, partial [Gemmatimonadota bacterium]|nr:site-specific integrase [Gemmatimonadota bacterium]